MSLNPSEIAALIVSLIVAIVFHEVAHGYVASLLGDPTAKEQKRLSLNPLRHVDPVGTVILPGMLALVKAPVFGWAKPVPVISQRLRNPRFGMMAVAAAGPGSNLIMAAFGAIAMGLLASVGIADAATGQLKGFLTITCLIFIRINIFLALFNLLPIPPFDGSHIVEGLLPRSVVPQYERLRPLGFPLVLIVLIVLPWMIPAFDPVGALVVPPVAWLEGQYHALAGAVARA